MPDENSFLQSQAYLYVRIYIEAPLVVWGDLQMQNGMLGLSTKGHFISFSNLFIIHVHRVYTQYRLLSWS